MLGKLGLFFGFFNFGLISTTVSLGELGESPFHSAKLLRTGSQTLLIEPPDSNECGQRKQGREGKQPKHISDSPASFLGRETLLNVFDLRIRKRRPKMV